jgi:hypothetical protein
MPFEDALQNMKWNASRVSREEWMAGEGGDPFVYLVPAASYPAQRGAAKAWAGENAMIPYPAYYAFQNGKGEVTPWSPTHADLNATDWIFIGEEVGK